MTQFNALLCLELKRRIKDFFVLFYNIIFPITIIMLLGYLTSKSYGDTFTSYNYYTIVIIPFCTLMGISTVSYASQDERLLHTSYRYIVAPINKKQIILSKFISCTIVFSVCNITTLLIAKFLFKLGFHKNFFIVILLICETIAVVGIGLFLGLAFKNLDTLRNFLNIPIVIFGFMGGVFFPISSFNPILSTYIKLSPLNWINYAIALYIYDNRSQMIFIISILLLVIGLIMVWLTIKFFKKEAFI